MCVHKHIICLSAGFDKGTALCRGKEKDKSLLLIKAQVAEQISLPSAADWVWMRFDNQFYSESNEVFPALKDMNSHILYTSLSKCTILNQF